MIIEKTIIAYLNDVLDVPVYAEEPIDKLSEYVVIEKTSSGMTNFIMSATIALQSYADTLLEAIELNEKVKEAMLNFVSVDGISASKLNTDYNYTNEQTKQYRYQAVFDLVFFN